MPRQKKEGAAEPKRRSRTGCWPCKARKVKCGEERPSCDNCKRQGETCDYSIRLNWEVRSKNKGPGMIDFNASPSPNVPGLVFPSPEAFTGQPSPSPTRSTFSDAAQGSQSHRSMLHVRSHSNLSLPPIGPSSDYGQQGDDRPANMTVMRDESQYGQNMEQPMRSPMMQPYMTVPHHEPGYPPIQRAMSGLGGYPPVPTVDVNGQPAPYMPPPYRGGPTSMPTISRSPSSMEDQQLGHSHRSKRAKMSISEIPVSAINPQLDSSPSVPTPHSSLTDTRSPNMPSVLLHSPFSHSTPLTPGSSIESDEQLRLANQLAPITTPQPPPDIRKLSVSSLLVDDPSETQMRRSTPLPEDQRSNRQLTVNCAVEHMTTYGYDTGQPDRDIPLNDDDNAIAMLSPTLSRESSAHNMVLCPEGQHLVGEDELASRGRDMAFEKDWYYAKPVPIKIPQSLQPLPPTLLENKMNLLYFHHFLNHTARILAPHDCEQNPYRSILPEMAIDDPDLLNLVLAYSASHRSKLLGHPAPDARIAAYTSDVVMKLRQAIKNTEPISLKSLATAITFASLEILSPSEGVKIPWRFHLQVAREMISARGGPLCGQRNDKFSYFLSRWFAYLDILGSLSGGDNDRPLGQHYWTNEGEPELDHEIDCLLGFTRRCATLLSKISDLIKQCELEGRLDSSRNPVPDWQPSDAIRQQAESLKTELQAGREYHYKPCNHNLLPTSTMTSQPTASEQFQDKQEILVTNNLYHWAGLIHLTTRVLNKPSSDSDVQRAVNEIGAGLHKVRQGSTAEACLLFPMFSAGVNARGRDERNRIMARLRQVENFGMAQMTKARKMMERVWQGEGGWESLVTDEFFG